MGHPSSNTNLTIALFDECLSNDYFAVLPPESDGV
ncbi:hypothetical protein J2R76_003786 [Bradyrhizobium sp. USDA 4532]|nr:hypothetical protein [Bradyrhizobium sp. USDA 4545]MCP1920195.1 hypothetical protein [Bradyrhizobium sp. USDA 4532]